MGLDWTKVELREVRCGSSQGMSCFVPALFINLDTSHPITNGVPSLTASQLTAYVTYAPALAPGAYGLVLNSTSGECQDTIYLPGTAVSYLSYGSGRSVHLGIGYSESFSSYTANVRTPGCPADRLLRQAIAWVAPASASGLGSTTGRSISGGSATGHMFSYFSILVCMCLVLFF